MNKYHNWINTGLVAALFVLVLVGGNNQSVDFGATGTRFPNGISADSTSPVAGEVRGTTYTFTSTGVLTGEATFDGGILQSSVLSTSTSGSATTLACSDIDGVTSIVMTPNVSDLTYTLPLETGMDNCLPNVGDRVSIALVNATTTAGIEITVAGNTNTNLRNASTSALVHPGGVAILDFVRTTATAIQVYISSGI